MQQLVEAFTRAGLHGETTAPIQTVEWSTFVAWLGSLVVSVLPRLETYKCLSDPDTALICTRLMRETAGLAAQWGIALTDMPAFHVHPITSGTEAEGVAHLQARGALVHFEITTPSGFGAFFGTSCGWGHGALLRSLARAVRPHAAGPGRRRPR